jgi:hypothetical protein
VSYAECCKQGRQSVSFEAPFGMGPEQWVLRDCMCSALPVKFCPFCGHDLTAPATLEEALQKLLENPFPLRLVFDVDGVCANDQRLKPYVDREVYPWVPLMMRVLKKAGHTVIFSTARYMAKCEGDQEKAAKAGEDELRFWLDCKGIHWDEIYLGKPSGDIYPDDRGCRVESNRGTIDWLTNFVPAVLATQDKKRRALRGE